MAKINTPHARGLYKRLLKTIEGTSEEKEFYPDKESSENQKWLRDYWRQAKQRDADNKKAEIDYEHTDLS